jgi:hypothetical protein
MSASSIWIAASRPSRFRAAREEEGRENQTSGRPGRLLPRYPPPNPSRRYLTALNNPQLWPTLFILQDRRPRLHGVPALALHRRRSLRRFSDDKARGASPLPTRPLRSPRPWCGRVPASPRFCAFCSRRSLAALLDAGAEGRSLNAFGVLSSRLGVSLGGPAAKAGARPTTSIRISSYVSSVRAWGRRLVFGALARRVASRLACRSPLPT